MSRFALFACGHWRPVDDNVWVGVLLPCELCEAERVVVNVARSVLPGERSSAPMCTASLCTAPAPGHMQLCEHHAEVYDRTGVAP